MVVLAFGVEWRAGEEALILAARNAQLSEVQCDSGRNEVVQSSAKSILCAMGVLPCMFADALGMHCVPQAGLLHAGDLNHRDG